MREIPDIEETVATADVFGSSLLSLVSLVDNAPDVISRFDRAGRYLFISQAAERYTGIPREAFLGKKYRELGFPEEVCQLWDASLRDTFATGDPTRIEFSVPLPVLGVRHYEGHSVAERAADGTIVSVLTVTRDISERKDAEEQSARLLHDLMEERETLDRINAIGRLLSAELDLDRLVQAATDAATELTGAQFGAFFYNVENEQGESYLLYTISGVPREAFSRFPMPRATHLFGPTFRGEGIIRIGDVLEDARYGQMAPHFGMPAGHLPVRSYLALPVLSRSGQVLGGLFFGHAESEVFTEKAERNVQALVAQLAVAMDNARLFREVTRATEQAQREVAARRESEELVRTIAENSTQGLAMMDERGYCTYANRAWLEMTGYSAEEIQSQPLHYLVHHHYPDGRPYPKEACPIDRALPENFDVRAHEDLFFRKDGSTFPVLVAASPIFKDGRPVSTVIEIRDVTAAKRLEEQRRTFLREVLFSLTEGRLRLCDRASELPRPLHPTPFSDPVALTRTSARTLRQQVRAAGQVIHLPAERANDLLTAVGETAMNAIVHGGGGEGSVYTDEARQRVQVWIRDHGPGIREEALHRAVLEKGYSTAGTFGVGFWLVLRTIDTVYLLTSPQGTTVVLEQAAVAPHPTWLTG
jgi:PAS domain S-box-containing protein